MTDLRILFLTQNKIGQREKWRKREQGFKSRNDFGLEITMYKFLATNYCSGQRTCGAESRKRRSFNILHSANDVMMIMRKGE
jgi:hypothetical protein